MKIQSQTKFYIALLLLVSRTVFAEMVHLASQEQYEEILKSGKPAVIKFGAEWCGACKSVKEAYAELGNEIRDVVFVDVDVDKFQPLAQKHNVMGIPTFLYVQNGSTKHQETGVKNPATFKDDVKTNISTQFGATHHDETPAIPASGHEMSMLAKLQAFIMSAFHAVKNMLMDIVAKIKSLFGK